MAIELSDLVQLYRKVDFNEEATYATYAISSQADADFIRLITADENFEMTQVDIVKGQVNVGQTLDLQINQPSLSLGWVYRTFQEFVRGDFSRALHKSDTTDKPYYIIELDYYSKENAINSKISNYATIKKLLVQLANMCVYSDTINKKLIFFSKYTFELSYDISNKIADFTSITEGIEEKTCRTIDELCAWLNDEETSKHLNEKKSILSFVLANIQVDSNSLHLFDVIYDVQNLYKSIRAQYDLYLEDFKYENFVKKLEENSEKFVQRINESISKVLSQVLALPIAAAAPVILKDTQIGSNSVNQVIIYVSLLAYAAICYFALMAQGEILKSIKIQVGKFEEQGKVPNSLKTQWELDKNFINTLILKQQYLYWIMLFIVCLAIFYSSLKICSVTFP